MTAITHPQDADRESADADPRSAARMAISQARRRLWPAPEQPDPPAVDTRSRPEEPKARRYHQDGSLPPPDAVFVFGSNLAGRHGKGAALFAAKQLGAVRGNGVGRQGRCYAIPTKGLRLEVLPLQAITQHVADFLAYAQRHSEQMFHVTRVGCDLAGYANAQIAPLFRSAPANCSFATEWREFLQPGPDPGPPADLRPLSPSTRFTR